MIVSLTSLIFFSTILEIILAFTTRGCEDNSALPKTLQNPNYVMSMRGPVINKLGLHNERLRGSSTLPKTLKVMNCVTSMRGALLGVALALTSSGTKDHGFSILMMGQ